uniref:Uncharacterized protein n=1 Tax=viral metagenome TaxID=1070528 RepID=A0A6C0BNH5_9ZZZZ
MLSDIGFIKITSLNERCHLLVIDRYIRSLQCHIMLILDYHDHDVINPPMLL